MTSIDFHADDYGLSENTSKDIISLCNSGKLNSISFLANMSCFDKTLEMFRSAKEYFPHAVKISVHLNLVEGKCLSGYDNAPHLSSKEGDIKISWGSLIIWSYNPFLRSKIRKELKNEIKLQIEKLLATGLVSRDCLRIDGHQHTQMIPIVFDALKDCISENGYKIEYVRNSEDPVIPYLFNLYKFRKFKPINIIKCFILNFYASALKRFLRKNNIQPQYLCGVFFSGCMDSRGVDVMLPELQKIAERKKMYLEALFHPGSLLPQEVCKDFVNPGANKFYLGPERRIEYNTLSNYQKGGYGER